MTPEIGRLRMDAESASRFAAMALGNVTREYPGLLVHVMAGPGDLAPPRQLHPAFYGSFDWHSCVHGCWLMARLLRAHPGLPVAGDVARHFDAHLNDQAMRVEIDYFLRPTSHAFERPYGWAWLLMLADELHRHRSARADRWHAAVLPLARLISERLVAFLAKAAYPVRSGTHANTAFALALAHVYASSHADAALCGAIESKAREWYGSDVDCQAWEPGHHEFLSPALIEALCMRRALRDRRAFRAWLERFLPRLRDGEPATLFRPVEVSDRTDDKLCHLDGLNLSRAWCWRDLAEAFDENELPLAARMRTVADEHLAAALPHLATSYAGEHWLATFAVLGMTTGAL